MLGTEIGEDRVGKMPFEQLRRPAFPFVQELPKCLVSPFVTMAAKHFRGSGRRTGAGVKERDANFAAGEGLIEGRQIADHQGKKGESHS